MPMKLSKTHHVLCWILNDSDFAKNVTEQFLHIGILLQYDEV